MSIEADQRAARELTTRTDQLGRISGRTPWHEALHRLSGGRLGRAIPIQLDIPWQNTPSPLRTGWRQRGANLAASPSRRGLHGLLPLLTAWVEEPHTDPAYQRCGLASAGLAALRAEHPGLAWPPWVGISRRAGPSGRKAGDGVPGGYQQRRLCERVQAF